MSYPNSKIYICKDVYLNPSYNHSIFFESAEAQRTYFSGKVVRTFSDYTYLRKNKSIRLPVPMDTAIEWNYLFFDNQTPGKSKTYFYFITDVQYINDNNTEIFIELDVMQTYAFDYQLQPCFIDREHSATDEVGENLVDEGLDVGELVTSISWDTTLLDDLCVLIMSTVNIPLSTHPTVHASRYNGIFGGAAVYGASMDHWQAIGASLDDETVQLGVITIWMYPKALIALPESETWDSGVVTKAITGIRELSPFTISKPTTIAESYEPKNKKLLTYPYNFLYVTNNSGGSAVYHYEKFADPNKVTFDYRGAISPEASVRMVPRSYNGVINNFECGISLGQFPTCAWNEDSYKLWLAQNQNTQGLEYLTAGLTIAGGIAGIALSSGTGAVVGGGAVLHGLSQISQLMAQKADKEIVPPQAKGASSGSLNIANKKKNFSFQRKSVDVNQARRIDDYFSMFGYKTNCVKVPNRAVRENWTFTKTVDCVIRGSLPKDDLTKIESVFNHGVTFWKDGDQIGNYNLSNNVL